MTRGPSTLAFRAARVISLAVGLGALALSLILTGLVGYWTLGTPTPAERRVLAPVIHDPVGTLAPHVIHSTLDPRFWILWIIPVVIATFALTYYHRALIAHARELETERGDER